MELGRKKVRLGELLVNSGVLTNEQLQQALDNPARQGKKLGEFLVDEGIVSEDDLAKALSRQLDLDMIDLQSTNVDKEVLNLVPVNVLKKNKIFPFAYKENSMCRIGSMRSCGKERLIRVSIFRFAILCFIRVWIRRRTLRGRSRCWEITRNSETVPVLI